MKLNISDQIAALPVMDKRMLLEVWSEHFSQSPPPKLRKELMVQILAYRIQEKEYGGLSHTARRRLLEIAASLKSRKQSNALSDSAPYDGTRLIRVWKGEVYEVQVSDGGFEYRGRKFNNLSVIAREITGTRWSGPLFFGTKKGAS